MAVGDHIAKKVGFIAIIGTGGRTSGRAAGIRKSSPRKEAWREGKKGLRV